MSFFPTGDRLPIVLQPDEGKLLDVLGEIITVKVAGEDTGEEYTILHEVSPPQGGPPLHLHHREDEAFYVLADPSLFSSSHPWKLLWIPSFSAYLQCRSAVVNL